MAEESTITGLDDVKGFLAELPAHIVVDCFPAALAAGGEVIERELRARTPEADSVTTSSKTYGRLVDDISTHVQVDGQQLSGSADTGFEKTGFVAVFVEYGHKSGDGTFTPAKPFIRPAAESATDPAVDAFTDSLNSTLDS